MDINIVSTYTADILREALAQYLDKICKVNIHFFYNQLFQQILFCNTAFSTIQQGLNVILFRVSDYYTVQEPSENHRKQENLLLALHEFNKQMKSPLLFMITPSFSCLENEEQVFDFWEISLKKALKTLQHIIVVGIDDFTREELYNIHNLFTEQHGHIPYHMGFYHVLAKKISRNYSLLSRKPFKVIVLDCDGTLWDGVIEEQGLQGIAIDSYDQDLQRFMIGCHERGLLLCLCSKNSENSILEVFNHHSEMLLQLPQHICTYRINWNAKSENIKNIAEELNLGLDSFIFLDDNPVECVEVRAAIPEMLVIELPREKSERCIYLQNIWAFDTPDKQNKEPSRITFYQTNRLRTQLKAQSISYVDFIHQLQIKTHITRATESDYNRINELGLRTNQFNTYPRVMTGIELHQAINSGCPNVLKIEVQDKFMKYGLVGVLVYEQNNAQFVVKSLFLSCRILNRGIEHEVMRYLTQLAERHAIKTLAFDFVRTERNIPALNFLKQLNHQKELSESPLIVSIQSVKNYSPVLAEERNFKSLSSETHCPVISHDYMLEIARMSSCQQHFLSRSINNFTTFNIHLNELFWTHHIRVDHNDTPLAHFGLTSLQSVLIAGEIYNTYGVEISPVDLLNGLVTMDDLRAELITKLKQITLNPALATYVASNKYPLSLAQRRLWYDEHLLDKKTSRNTLFAAFQFEKPINKIALNKAIKSLLEQHELLRCFFVPAEEPFIFVVSLDEFSVDIDYKYFKTAAEIDSFVLQFKGHYFDLEVPPLFRITVLNPEDNRAQLLFSIHHIIHDGWSLNKLLKDLSLYYNLYSTSALDLLASRSPSTHAYGSYISWEQTQYTESLRQKNTLFWSSYLRKLPKMELVYDHPAQELTRMAPCSRIPFKLNAYVSNRLIRWSRAYHVTLFECLATAFGVFLSQLTRQEEIHFVTATSGRYHAKTAELIGFFVNLLIVRLTINPSKPFVDLVKEAKKNIANVMLHQSLPFHEISQQAKETFCTKNAPLHQVGFIYQSYPIHPLDFNGSIGKRVHTEDKAALLYDDCRESRFGNLVCFMQEFEGQIHGLFEYNKLLFKAETIKHYIDSFIAILTYVSKAPSSLSSEISLLSTRQKKLLSQRWSGKIQPNEPCGNLLSQFSKIVDQYPHKVAVEDGENKITYSQLHEQSSLLAKQLLNEETIIKAPVALYLERGLSQIIAILAVLKAGGCYIPLDTDLPHQRINNILQHANTTLLLIDNHTKLYLTTYMQNNLAVVNLSERVVIPDISPMLINKARTNQVAYVLYTSGSTGSPKGVMIEHSGILRLVCNSNYVTIKPQDRIAQASQVLFDASTFEIWGALLNGATLICMTQDVLLNQAILKVFLKENRISILFLTTQLFHTYAYLSPELFTDQLRYLVVGGEALLAEPAKRVMSQKKPPRHLINGYGPTENTTFSTTYTIKNKDDIPNPIPIGKPIKGTHVFVLTDTLQLAPIGAIGTLYLGGLGLARAYLHQELLTSEKFIHLFGERLYNTGDLVVWQSDGNLRYIGRDDHQIKLNGYRIELSEIETQLNTHLSIEQSVVLVKHQEHHRCLAAYIVVTDKNQHNNLTIMHHLKNTLPSYMIPQLIYQVDLIPMTLNGKVDRNQLEKLTLEPMKECPFEAPETLAEQQLASIYAKILNVDCRDISVYTDFFDMGGNSISALQLIHQVGIIFPVNLTLSTLYERSSIKTLSQYITAFIGSAMIIGNTKTPLKQIKKGSSKKKPLIFIHPIGGTGFCYMDLIKNLSDDQPCYLIQDPSIDANKILFKNMRAMATHYNQLVISYFGHKSFVLAGYSFGGMLSLEMVSQLEHIDIIVPGIVAFDTWIISRFLNENAKALLKQSMMKQYQQIEEILLKEHIQPKPWMQLYYIRLQELGFSYIPPKINAKIILFKAQEMVEEFAPLQDSFNFLQHHSSQPVELYAINGTHNNILQSPNVQKIATIMKKHPLLSQTDE